MRDLSVLIKRIEGQTTILMQARNLNNYLLASLSGHDSQGIVTQVSAKIQLVVGGLFQIVEEIRASKPGPGQEHKQDQEPPKRVDTDDLVMYLTTTERADLGQLNRAHDDLNSALSLVISFRDRLFNLGYERQVAGDRRAD